MIAKYLTAYFISMWITIAQAGNLAIRQPSFLSSIWGDNKWPAYAVDGNPDPPTDYYAVTLVQKDPYWIVDLGRTYVVDEVHVVGRHEICCATRLIDTEIRVGNRFDNGGASNAKCAVIQSYTGQLKKSFRCSPSLRGRYVSLNLPGESKIIELVEVTVNQNPSANIALQKPASQSSLGNNYGQASNAVDGNSDGNFGNYRCSTTNQDNNPWWRVDLGSSKPVSEVFIVNRAALKERLTNIEIRVGDSLTDNGNNNPRCGGIYTMATLYKKSFYCQPRKTGRYVNVRLVSMGGPLFLTLCEVEVYSESKAIIVSDQTNTTSLPNGLPVSLTCPQVFGYPQPYVAWARGGVVYQNTTNTTVFQNNALNENRNESEWECIASNMHGSDFHKFYFKGEWHRMCAKHEILASKRSVQDLIENSDEASNESSLNESLWFRFQHPTTSRSMQIPESYTPSMSCSTQATGWLLGSHPGIQHGVVRRTVCFSWTGNCCRYNTSILIRRCHGFYVYKLQKTSFDVKAGYCAELSSALGPNVMLKQVGQSGDALANHVINIEHDLDLYECITVCLSQPLCKSLNHDSKMCELNSAKRHDVSPSDWRKRQGNVHYELIDIASSVVY